MIRFTVALLMLSLSLSFARGEQSGSNSNHKKLSLSLEPNDFIQRVMEEPDEDGEKRKKKELTNEENTPIIKIDPFQLKVFGLTKRLSVKGVKALTQAASDHATIQVQKYFEDSLYKFDEIVFEVLEIAQKRKVVDRNLREHDNHPYKVDQELDLAERRRDQELKFSASIVFGGNATFLTLPAATSEETNDAISEAMGQNWRLKQAIRSSENDELQSINAVTVLDTVAPTLELTSSPTMGPTLLPTLGPPSPTLSPIAQTQSPTSSPTKSAVLIPVPQTQPPTPSPTPSPTPTPSIKVPDPEFPVETKVPTPSPTTIIPQLPEATPMPTFLPTKKSTPNGINEIEGPMGENPTAKKDLPLGIIIGSLTGLLMLVIGLIFFVKKRRRSIDTRSLSDQGNHRRLFSDDFGDHPSGKKFTGYNLEEVPTISSIETKEDLGTSSDSALDEAELGNSPESSLSPLESSIASSKTMRTKNTSELNVLEKSWFNTITPPRSSVDNNVARNQMHSSDKPPLENSGNDGAFPADLKTPDSEKSIAISGNLKNLFSGNQKSRDKKSQSIISSPQKSKLLSSSPITAVTPSKVSKEEFERGWDDDLPFNWNPVGANAEKKLNSTEKPPRSHKIFNTDGSFPTFDSVNSSPVVRSRLADGSRGNNSQADSSFARSYGDSSAYQSTKEINSLDWSNKGSEFDLTSHDDSTLTDGVTTPNGNRAVWKQYSDNEKRRRSAIGLNTTAEYLTPRSQISRFDLNTPMTQHTESSKQSDYTYSSNGGSSRGSSKELINDLVWLEKKIADVKARVDRLDGDDSGSVDSGPLSPVSDDSGGISPISNKIVCRDVIAPPGKLGMIIHSTKDGPAVHSIKPDSALEGKLFSGDLLVGVDGVDTRSSSAEDVMEMMTSKMHYERKITAIHFKNGA